MGDLLAGLITVNGLDFLQRKFALSTIGGEVRVVDLDEVDKIQRGTKGVTLNLYKRADASLLMRRRLEEQPVRTKPTDDINKFFVHPATVVYRSTVFTPGAAEDYELNLWSPPPIKASPGNWSLLKSHIVDVICDSSTKKAAYLLNYFAHMLQKPEEKPGVMIVLKGEQVTGKSACLLIVRRIWSGSSLVTADIDHVVGRFNSSLESSYVVQLEEALFKGNKKGVDKLKSLISESSCHIEVKYQPPRTIGSLHRFFATTNHKQFSHTDIDDRRHAFFEVSDSKQGDQSYFDALFAAIFDDQVIAAMIDELKNRDISEFNVRAVPKTKDHGDQVLRSLSGLDRYWYQLLGLGEIPMSLGYVGDWNSAGLFVATRDLLESYRSFDSLASKYERPSPQDVSQLIKRFCCSAKSDRVTKGGRTTRGYTLPDLEAARGEFETAVGISIAWD